MKTKLLFIYLIFCCAFVNAQMLEDSYIPTSNVPAIVVDQQEKLFPENYIENWSSSGEDEFSPDLYTAHYRERGKDGLSATYSKDGLFLFNMKYLNEDLLPETVIIKVRNLYNKFEIQYGYLIELQTPKQTIYRVNMLDNARLRYAYFTINGMEIPENSLPEELILLRL